ncbi:MULTISPECIES: hypothetical protein [Sphingobacterium]|uniref:hypothetical protein n=1 Tax=Sphingobacterium TaxID=28453 RepID=UPI001969B2D8|nr:MULTISPECIES: hypothetical protein [unclassified Sphingobacterium]
MGEISENAESIFTNAALEKITGINQRQLQHYSSGLKKPRQPQLKKMEERHHHLTAELKALELILIQIIR